MTEPTHCTGRWLISTPSQHERLVTSGRERLPSGGYCEALEKAVANGRDSQVAVLARHGNSGLNAQQWNEFRLICKGDVDKSLAAYIAWADGEVRKLNGVPQPPGDPNAR